MHAGAPSSRRAFSRLSKAGPPAPAGPGRGPGSIAAASSEKRPVHAGPIAAKWRVVFAARLSSSADAGRNEQPARLARTDQKPTSPERVFSSSEYAPCSSVVATACPAPVTSVRTPARPPILPVRDCAREGPRDDHRRAVAPAVELASPGRAAAAAFRSTSARTPRVTCPASTGPRPTRSYDARSLSAPFVAKIPHGSSASGW